MYHIKKLIPCYPIIQPDRSVPKFGVGIVLGRLSFVAVRSGPLTSPGAKCFFSVISMGDLIPQSLSKPGIFYARACPLKTLTGI